MKVNRNRGIYLILMLLVVALGLSSRLDFLPKWVHLYVGDALWALMVYFGIGMLFNRKSIYWVAVAAILVAFSIEISQLYQAVWINEIRNTKVGGLVLGFGFLWSDLFLYTLGVGIGVLFEKHSSLLTKE